jgi:general transcription factor 3C polypeptide 5 (transcription factor C subunit 1)
LELNYRWKDPFAHPIRGDLLDSRQFLLKLEKDDMGNLKNSRIIGRITQIARFRAMADYQYLSNMKSDSTRLRSSIEEGDCKWDV